MSRLYEITKSKDDSAKTTEPADDGPVTKGYIPPGVDRRKFIMRSAVIGAAAVMTGRTISAKEIVRKATSESPLLPQQSPAPPLDKNLNVVKKGQGPVMTT